MWSLPTAVNGFAVMIAAMSLLLSLAAWRAIRDQVSNGHAV
jgi:hypothetical protein